MQNRLTHCLSSSVHSITRWGIIVPIHESTCASSLPKPPPSNNMTKCEAKRISLRFYCLPDKRKNQHIVCSSGSSWASNNREETRCLPFRANVSLQFIAFPKQLLFQLVFMFSFLYNFWPFAQSFYLREQIFLTVLWPPFPAAGASLLPKMTQSRLHHVLAITKFADPLSALLFQWQNVQSLHPRLVIGIASTFCRHVGCERCSILPFRSGMSVLLH